MSQNRGVISHYRFLTPLFSRSQEKESNKAAGLMDRHGSLKKAGLLDDVARRLLLLLDHLFSDKTL